MIELPKGVLLERDRLSRLSETGKLRLLEKLTQDEACAQMWRALERRSYAADNPERDDGLWVSAYLNTVLIASTPPRYQLASTSDRKDLASRLEKMSDDICRLLDVYDLDFHLVSLNGKMFNGLYVYEDFGESNQARIKEAGDPLLLASTLIRDMIGHSIEQINSVPPAKQGANAEAIRFVRELAKRNQQMYREVLNSVIATSANALYGTSYAESDIRNLLTRMPASKGLQS